jgi:hypothetical protein
MDKTDLGAISETDVWNDALYAKAYLDYLANANLPGWEGFSNECDEAGPDRGGTFIYGDLNANNTRDTWAYDRIRLLNEYIGNIEKGSIAPATQKLYKAQALVLRAWRYFDMVYLYGGVPMVMTVQNLSDDLLVTRNKTSECISLIIQDLDEAIATENLPYSWSGADAGRISKAAALAIKGRVLLYWASPQFNPNNQQDRWQTAYDANKEAKELLEANGYGLYANFANFWFDEMNKEVVFVKRHDINNGHGWEAGTRPSENGLGMNGNNKPTWEMAQAFPMIDGTPIEESPDYDDVHYWRNRDPRFAATLAWNSAEWDLAVMSATSIVGKRLWTYREVNYPSHSHLYCRKAIDPTATIATTAPTGKNATDWVEIRFAEVLMNYAECAAMLGRTDEAYAVLKQIRERAGILPGANNMYGLKANMTQGQMMDAIKYERRIEFAFEGKRFFDLRRWRMLTDLNGKRRHGRKPVLLMSESEFEPLRLDPTIDFDKDYSLYFRDEIEEIDIIRVINFQEGIYFFPIKSDHLYRNSRLEQTQGWDDGTFNPLE